MEINLTIKINGKDEVTVATVDEKPVKQHQEKQDNYSPARLRHVPKKTRVTRIKDFELANYLLSNGFLVKEIVPTGDGLTLHFFWVKSIEKFIKVFKDRGIDPKQATEKIAEILEERADVSEQCTTLDKATQNQL